MQRFAICLLAVALSGSGIAAGSNPCGKLTAQQDLNICIGNAVKDADVALNRVYRELAIKLDANGKRNLVAAERAWITFRDRECDLRSGYDTEHLENNGTIAPFLVGQCKLDLTNRRAEDLRVQLKCPGGDLSCPQ